MPGADVAARLLVCGLRLQASNR